MGLNASCCEQSCFQRNTGWGSSCLQDQQLSKMIMSLLLERIVKWNQKCSLFVFAKQMPTRLVNGDLWMGTGTKIIIMMKKEQCSSECRRLWLTYSAYAAWWTKTGAATAPFWISMDCWLYFLCAADLLRLPECSWWSPRQKRGICTNALHFAGRSKSSTT